MLLAKTLTQSKVDNQPPGADAIRVKGFFIKREKTDALRLRIKFLAYEAHVDLLEIVSFFATVNLAALCTQGATTGLPGNTFDFLFRFCPPMYCTGILSLLAAGELWASLFDRKIVRCWIQFAAFIVFSGYAVLVFCKSPWIPSPRDYVIFGIMAGVAHLRLRSETRGKKRRKYATVNDIADSIRASRSESSKSGKS